MQSNLAKIVTLRLAALSYSLSQPLAQLAERCGECIDQPELLNRLLSSNQTRFENGSLFYVINPFGIQISANIAKSGVDSQYMGQNLSEREWFKLTRDSSESLYLSDVYVSQPDNVIGITAVHQIYTRNGTLLGYLCVDFKLENLPYFVGVEPETNQWKRLAGDPSIRDLMFHHKRTVSEMETQFESLRPIIKELILSRGIFHFKFHFSASRATLWHYDDPMRYQVILLEDMLQPSLCLAYDKRPLPEEISITDSILDGLFDLFFELRTSDDYLYVRSCSVNVVNGLVGLNLSWDSQHYLAIDEFLNTDPLHWIGSDNVWFGDDVRSGT
jgi:hypothetical protein